MAATLEDESLIGGVAAAMLAPVAMFTLAVVAISTTQAVWQFWMFDLVYGLAEHVNLFRAKPLYAFSGLTSRTGMSFLVLVYFVAAMRPDIVRETPALQVPRIVKRRVAESMGESA